MAHPTTERAESRRVSSGASSTAVDDLVAVLRETPSYKWQWPQLRRQGEGGVPAFDEAAELVRAGWSTEERLRQMQLALAETAAQAALARVTAETTAGDSADIAEQVCEHVRRAGEALKVAQELIRLEAGG